MRKLLAFLTVLFVATGLAFFLPPGEAYQASREEPPAAANNKESARVRFARAHLELAKLDLRRARALNKQSPHLVTEATIEELERHVAIDEEQLNEYLREDNADLRKIYIRMAQSTLANAEAELKRQHALHKSAPGPFTELDVARAEAVVKLAQVNLERTQSQLTSETIISNLQWQIEELRNELLELQVKQEGFNPSKKIYR